VSVTKQTSWWSRLGTAQKAGLLAAIIVLPCCGGLTAIGALAGDDEPAAKAQHLASRPSAAATTEAAAAPEAAATTEAATTAEAAASGSAEAIQAATEEPPQKATVTKTEPIEFKTREVDDDDLDQGDREVRTEGKPGVRTLVYEVVTVHGAEVSRKLISTKVTRKPVTEVVAVGTHEEEEETGGGCTPGYSPCVPVASDVDCAGGSGNGPAYVDGPIRVTGSDPYDLDRDGDGIACDS
jgi:resuscitation-promoting factor RpfB